MNFEQYQALAARNDSAMLALRATPEPAAQSRSDWPELQPLEDFEPPAPDAFPMDALDKTAGDAAKTIADTVQAADSLAAGSVLAAGSLATQSLANVVLPHGARVPLSLFMVTSASSGDRKSAVDAVALAAIHMTT